MIFVPSKDCAARPKIIQRLLGAGKAAVFGHKPHRVEKGGADTEPITRFFGEVVSPTLEFRFHEDSESGLRDSLVRAHVDIALPINGTLGSNCPIPWVSYLFDFQHRYLTENFTSDECFNRETHFIKILRESRSIIVNSSAVKDDIKRFYPWTDLSAVTSLPFSPMLMSDWMTDFGEDIRELYSLPRHYFLVSNQFWVHKDHPTAIRALALLRRHADVGLVCTGSTTDWRRPRYLEEIKSLVSQLNLENHVRILGHIPKRHQIEIMKSARAVLQPTLFEGGPGGGSVYDAVSLGLPVILSDIPVNREVEGEGVQYFQIGNAENLAVMMKGVLEKTHHRPGLPVLLANAARSADQLGNALLVAAARAMPGHL